MHNPQKIAGTFSPQKHVKPLTKCLSRVFNRLPRIAVHTALAQCFMFVSVVSVRPVSLPELFRCGVRRFRLLEVAVCLACPPRTTWRFQFCFFTETSFCNYLSIDHIPQRRQIWLLNRSLYASLSLELGEWDSVLFSTDGDQHSWKSSI